MKYPKMPKYFFLSDQLSFSFIALDRQFNLTQLICSFEMPKMKKISTEEEKSVKLEETEAPVKSVPNVTGKVKPEITEKLEPEVIALSPRREPVEQNEHFREEVNLFLRISRTLRKCTDLLVLK